MLNKEILTIFIGNPIFGDDRIGLLIGEKINKKLNEEGISTLILEKPSFSLIDFIEDKENIIIIDSIKTGKHKVGECFIINFKDFNLNFPFSPHYIGIPEILALIKEIKKEKKNVFLIGIEVENPFIISEKISEELLKNINNITECVYKNIKKIIENLK